MTKKKTTQIRYAVIGLGYISQVAVLPAFGHASKNSKVTALVSDDSAKLKTLSRRYGIQHTYSYEEYEQCLTRGEIDAVYIALPNSLHCDYVVRAANAGIHCLCEKPLAVTTADCLQMINACSKNNVKLMTAYRLHFDEANLKAAHIASSGKIGIPRIFQSVFSQQVRKGNIRLSKDLGGGAFYDLGIYCINAARYIFKAEPKEVHAFTATRKDARFGEVDEMAAVLLRFPGECLALLASSFGAAAVGWFEIIGTKGSLRVEKAYEYANTRIHHLTINDKTRTTRFGVTDQFAPELLYFSDCILRNKVPEPGGEEGLADVSVIEAIGASARTGKPVMLPEHRKRVRPTLSLKLKRPKVKRPPLVHASTPSP